MKKRIEPLTGFIVAALALGVMGASKVPDLPMTDGSAMIFNPGNGDYAGFRIAIAPSGQATAVDAAGRASGDVSVGLAQRFFDDLSSASKSAKDASGTCAAAPSQLETTTVSVNAAVSIAWRGRHWSDVGCAADPKLAKLSADAAAIERALYVQAYRERTIVVYVGNRGQNYSPSSAQQQQSPYGYGGSNGYGGSGDSLHSRFAVPRFTTFGSYGVSPYSGYPSGTAPWSSMPLTSLSGGLPSASLPYSTPYSSLPSASLSTSSPYDSSPFCSSPY